MKVLQFASTGTLKEVQVAANLSGLNYTKENFTLSAADVLQNEIVLSAEAIENSVSVSLGAFNLTELVDFTVSTTAGISKITFINNATTGGLYPIEENDQVCVQYVFAPNWTTIEFRIFQTTLTPIDVSNQFIELPEEAQELSTKVIISGLKMCEGVDYTTSVVGGKTRLNWVGNLSAFGVSALETGDFVTVNYSVTM